MLNTTGLLSFLSVFIVYLIMFKNNSSSLHIVSKKYIQRQCVCTKVYQHRNMFNDSTAKSNFLFAFQAPLLNDTLNIYRQIK